MEREPTIARAPRVESLLAAWTALLTSSSSSSAQRQFEIPPAWDHALRGKIPEPASVAIFLESTRGLDDDAFVEAAYRAWLRREPNPSGRTAYVEGLAVGSRSEMIASVLQSEESRFRPLEVAVVPHHRVFNAATLQYLAEAERRPLRFRRAVNGGDLEGADTALVTEGGAQGPWPESRPSLEVLEAIEGTDRDGPGYPCPDGSRVMVLPLGN